MKVVALTFCTLFLFCNLIWAQPNISWKKNFGGSGVENPTCIIPTLDGGYVMVGNTMSSDGDITEQHGGMDIWVVKVDINGVKQWQRALGGSGDEYPGMIKQTADGGYIIIGSTGSTDGDVSYKHNSMDAWVVKLNESGTMQWEKTIGGSALDYAYCIQPTNDGGYIISGATTSADGDVDTNRGGIDYMLVKLTSTGNTSWVKTYGGSNDDIANFVQPTTDGGYIICGSSNSTDGQIITNYGAQDIWIVKTDNVGVIQWQKSYGGNTLDYASMIQNAVDGGYVVAGTTYSADQNIEGNHGGMDYWVIKLNVVGEMQWQKTLGGSEDDYCNSIFQTTDGGYILGGYTNSNDSMVTGYHDSSDAWVVKLSAAGVMQWEKTYGGSRIDYANWVQPTNDGGYIMAISSQSNNCDVTNNLGDFDFWILKLAGTGTGIATEESNDIKLFPNPTKSILFVESKEPLNIKVADLTGKLLSETKLDKFIDLTHLASGMYIVQLYNEDGVLVHLERVVKE